MAIPQTKSYDMHWNYYLTVEEDLKQLARFVEFHEDNFECFSIEKIRILVASCTGIEAICKQICKRINPASKADTITKYQKEIIAAYPKLPKFRVYMKKYGLEFNPWENWENVGSLVGKSPDWWKSYTSIKHNRHEDYKKANLKNVLNAVAALFIIYLYLEKDRAKAGILKTSISLFEPDSFFTEGIADFTINEPQYKIE